MQRGGGPLVTYAQRVSATGVPLWNPNGIVVCRAFGGQMNLSAVSDGSGGAIVAWQDGRGGSGFDIYAQRIDGTGALRWANDGVALSTAAAIQARPAIASDGHGRRDRHLGGLAHPADQRLRATGEQQRRAAMAGGRRGGVRDSAGRARPSDHRV